MLSTVRSIRNLCIILAALALATGCLTAKTLDTPVSAVTASPAASSDTTTAEATTDTGTAKAASSDTATAEATEVTTDTGTADTATAEVTEATTDTGTADTATAEVTEDTGAAEVAEVTAPVSWTPSPLTKWVVQKGEHLWSISADVKVYGDPYQWPLLFKKNRHQIEDADLIYPGQVLHIERDLSSVPRNSKPPFQH